MSNLHIHLLLGTSALLLYKVIEVQRSYKFQMETMLGSPRAENFNNLLSGVWGVAGLIISVKYLLNTK